MTTFTTIRNFRDCGGYPTRDGRMLRTGRLYRTAQFHDASDDDLRALRELGITTIVDLRRPGEREKYPSRRLPDFPGAVVEHPGMDDVELPPHLSAMEGAGASAETARAAMLEIYRSFPADPMLVVLYREFFNALAMADGAVLVHCAAGKDRTGLIVALAQHIAGLERDTIMTHYLKTNQSELVSELAVAAMRENAAREGRVFSDGAIRTVLSVVPEYLETSFETIEAQHGSLDRYLEDVLGVSGERREKIRGRLVA
jgi:protein tyrosine/serine phosphatase